jgi:hypothetical protein
MALASANFHTGRYGAMSFQFDLAFSLEEAPTFGRGSSLKQHEPDRPDSSVFFTSVNPDANHLLPIMEFLMKSPFGHVGFECGGMTPERKLI